jgi:hypothetical protein
MFLKNEKWADANGLRHKRFVVRSMGRNRGFGIMDSLCNNFVLFSEPMSRADAKQALELATAEHYQHWCNFIDASMKKQRAGA